MTPHSIALVSSPGCGDFYDFELRAHHEHLRAAYGISPGDRVLDIGCGGGLTTREAARAAAPGRVLGVDISEPMLERARSATDAEQLSNVEYELGDAQTHQFAAGAFDVAISRFGTMFFADPAAAFANIATALRPGARLVLLVWQRSEHNPGCEQVSGALDDDAPPRHRAWTRARSAMSTPPRACSRTPDSRTCTSRTSARRSSTATTSTPRSGSSGPFRPPATPSRSSATPKPIAPFSVCGTSLPRTTATTTASPSTPARG